MRKVLFTVFLCVNFMSFGQSNDSIPSQPDKKKSDFWEHVRFGGSFGLNFGNNFTTLGLTPSAIYDFNDTFSLGGSVGYTYSKNGDFKSNVFTGSILSIYSPFPKFELSGEFEQLFVNQKFGNIKDNYNYPALYVGLAYRTRNISIGGRFDLLYDENKSIYGSPFTPVFRVFF